MKKRSALRMLLFFLPLLLAVVPILSGCSTGVTSPLGATVGGAQDIGYARQTIENGGIPEPDAIVSEGLYSEHDIATLPGLCGNRLCLSLGYGYAPAVDDGRQALFVQLGMTSNISADDFKRSPLQLALVIDKSGSMQWGSMSAVKSALHSLVGKLTPDDEICLIAFNTSAELLLPMTSIGDGRTIRSAIDKLEAQGGTNIEAGLGLGFDQVAKAAVREGYMKRVMLFTDAMPNHGSTDKGSFKELAARYAEEDIGLTAFGVGVDFGQELTYYITGLRGGNFFFLENAEKIRKVFEKEFDYLVTPIVYDLNIKVPTPSGFRLRAVYGLPTWKPGSPDAELHIPTVFLSSNRGAIILRYERDDQAEMTIDQGALLATGSIGYMDPVAGAHSRTAELRHAGGSLAPGNRFYSHDGARLAVALTNVYFGLREGCTLAKQGKRQEALAIVEGAKASAEIDNAALNHAGLASEIKLLEKLAANIRSL